MFRLLSIALLGLPTPVPPADAAAALTVEVSADQATASTGDTVRFTVRAHNTGTVAITRARIVDDLSDVLDDAVFNDDATSGATVLGTELRWVVTLQAGSEAIASYSVTVGGPVPALAQLAALTVADEQPMTGYSRDRFAHWRAQGGGCDTREAVLIRQGDSVVTGTSCAVVSGSWLSPYDCQTITVSSGLDIDHVVPLAAAWRSGAAAWTDARRSDFANDLAASPQLLAVSPATNRSKGDQDPADWRPPSQSYYCRYASDWTKIKTVWGLTIRAPEKAALTDMLATCGIPAGNGRLADGITASSSTCEQPADPNCAVTVPVTPHQPETVSGPGSAASVPTVGKLTAPGR